MSLNETQLSILFVDRATREQIQAQFELLRTSAQAFNKQMAGLGVKTKFTDENPFPEGIREAESFLQLDFTHDSSFRFPIALLKKLPGASLIVQTVSNDQDLGGKKTYLYGGESINKDQLIERLDALDPRIAAGLSSHLGVRLASKYFKALADPNEEFVGVLMFWHLIHFIDRYPAVRSALAKCDLNRANQDGDTVLHYAAKTYRHCGDEDIEWLISQGCDVNARNANGDTPLLVASRLPYKRNGAMYRLLRHGAEPNIRDRNGLAAIHHVCATENGVDMVGALRHRNADLNADSPMGSPLWIANAADRYAARQKLWPLNLQLRYPASAYGGDAYANLLTAVKHHDIASMARYIDVVQLGESQVQALYVYACYFQCGVLFDHLQRVHPWRLVADTTDPFFGRDYALNHLDLLDDEHPAVGDSYRIFVAAIAQSNPAQLHALAQTRDFAVNCLRVVVWRSAQALDFFGLLKTKALAFEQLFSGNGLGVGWHDKEDVPANIAEVLIALRAMGLVFHGSEYGLKNAGLSDDLVQQLCRP